MRLVKLTQIGHSTADLPDSELNLREVYVNSAHVITVRQFEEWPNRTRLGLIDKHEFVVAGPFDMVARALGVTVPP